MSAFGSPSGHDASQDETSSHLESRRGADEAGKRPPARWGPGAGFGARLSSWLAGCRVGSGHRARIEGAARIGSPSRKRPAAPCMPGFGPKARSVPRGRIHGRDTPTPERRRGPGTRIRRPACRDAETSPATSHGARLAGKRGPSRSLLDVQTSGRPYCRRERLPTGSPEGGVNPGARSVESSVLDAT
jgi:hypothetical protein